jgi:hypothetical protein
MIGKYVFFCNILNFYRNTLKDVFVIGFNNNKKVVVAID